MGDILSWSDSQASSRNIYLREHLALQDDACASWLKPWRATAGWVVPILRIQVDAHSLSSSYCKIFDGAPPGSMVVAEVWNGGYISSSQDTLHLQGNDFCLSKPNCVHIHQDLGNGNEAIQSEVCWKRMKAIMIFFAASRFEYRGSSVISAARHLTVNHGRQGIVFFFFFQSLWKTSTYWYDIVLCFACSQYSIIMELVVW